MSAAGTVLLVEDEDAVRLAIRAWLADLGHVVLEAVSGADAERQLERGVDVVLLDYCLPDMTGVTVLERVLRHDPQIPVIMMTAHSSVRQAVEVMERGAYYYLAKPVELAEVSDLVGRALVGRRLGDEDDVDALLPGLVGTSSVMRDLKTRVLRVARSPGSTVLVTGESGTGKDLVARAIHQLSERSERPFVNITCSALPSALLESELFGHERGAFTDARQRKVGLLEAAEGGTVFLDEIGEMEPVLQAKLLRFLEEKVIRRVGGTTDIRTDVRIIAATNVDLIEAVKQRAFRQDLYYRLCVLSVNLPPLSAREGDIPILLDHFIRRFNRELGTRCSRVTGRAMALLVAHGWPGNVRELRNLVERAVVLGHGPLLDVKDFDALVPARAGATGTLTREDFVLPREGVNLKELERSLLEQALTLSGGSHVEAGRLLGMNRDQIRYRVGKLGLR